MGQRLERFAQLRVVDATRPILVELVEDALLDVCHHRHLLRLSQLLQRLAPVARVGRVAPCSSWGQSASATAAVVGGGGRGPETPSGGTYGDEPQPR